MKIKYNIIGVSFKFGGKLPKCVYCGKKLKWRSEADKGFKIACNNNHYYTIRLVDSQKLLLVRNRSL